MKRNNPTEAILAMSGGLIVFYLFYKITVLLIIALCLIVVGLSSAFITSKITWLWLGFAKILGYINSRIILGVIYYFILFPIAMLKKFFNRKNNLKSNPSNFFIREHVFTKTDFEKPF